jgi:hypothetical protein
MADSDNILELKASRLAARARMMQAARRSQKARVAARDEEAEMEADAARDALDEVNRLTKEITRAEFIENTNRWRARE